jgi:O-antigen/teichoic acid export membrane protein
MTQSSITRKTITGFFWAFSGSAAQSFLRVLLIIVLARLLSPAEFGLVGAGFVIVGFADVFSQLGVSPAIVQRQNLTENHIGAGFALSIGLSLATGILIAALSPLVALAFKMPGLTPIVAALALTFPIRGLSVVAEALLQREMRFRAIASVSIASFMLGYAPVAITLAALHWSVWSIVLAQLVQTALLSAGLILVSGHAIRLSFDREAIGDIMHFGVGISIARIGNYIALNGDNFIVGRYLGAVALGFYSRAYQFLMQPTNLIGGVIDRVLFPAMVSVQDDQQKLVRAYRRCLALGAMITLPLSAVLVVLAPNIIHLLLGARWVGTIVPFQFLAASLVGRVGYKVSDTLARAKGAVYRGAWRQWIYAVFIVCFAFAGLFWDLDGVAAGVAIAIVLQYGIMLEFGRAFADVSWLKIAAIHLRHGFVALLVAGLLLAVTHVLPWHSDIAVIAAGCGAAVVGILVLWLAFPALFGEEGRWLSSQIRQRFA